MSLELLPWHEKVWERLAGMGERLPHALLFHGRPGIGKLQLAKTLAQSLLCEQRSPEGLACGKCPACGWFAADNHPDFRYVQPEILAAADADAEGEEAVEEGKKKPSKQIKIQQIVALRDFLNAGSHRGGYRVILIHPAETMNPSAANALLKSLEEPSSGAVFLLVSHQPSRLLPTVRSRCHAVPLSLPPREQSLRWLQQQGSKVGAAALAFAGEAPLAAAAVDQEEEAVRRKLAQLLSERGVSALTLSDYCQRLQPGQVVEWMLKWTYDLVSIASGGAAHYHVAEQDQLVRLAQAMPSFGLLRFYRTLTSMRAIAEHPLNVRLFFDDLFLAYKEIG